MRLQTEDLISIAERSAFLYERLGPDFVLPKHHDSESTKARLERWCKQSTRGNEQRFQKRLAWDGLDLVNAGRLLSRPRLKEPGRLPSWARSLQTAIAEAGKLAGKSTLEVAAGSSYLNISSPIAFEHLFVPFVNTAASQLKETNSHLQAVGSAPYHHGLQRYLLHVLSQAAERTLEAEFAVWRSLPGAKELAWSASREPDRPLYSAFLQAMWNGGLRDLLCEYPVLARWLGTACETWKAFAAEVATHLKQDWKELEATFNHDHPLGGITAVDAGLSERHARGKTVLRISFASGLQLYYKPRNLESDRAYNRLVSWLNEHGAPLELQSFRALNHHDHGWSESVLASPCTSPEEVGRYYQRAGMLLCLLYALQGTDCNYQNIVASGEQPVLIDTETLVQPRPVQGALAPQSDLSAAYVHFICDSVFRAGLLPRWTPSASSVFDASGLGAAGGDRGTWMVKSWQNINTDSMRLQWHHGAPAAAGHEPYLAGKRTDPAEHVEDVTRGFKEMYGFLAAHREELFRADGPLPGFSELRIRYLFRSTGTYTRLLDHCALPDHLRSGIDTSICLDVLARHFLAAETKPGAWPILLAEHITLAEMDVPRFTVQSNSQLLDSGEDRLIHGLFSASGFKQVESRFQLLSEQDLGLQLGYIRSSLQSAPNGEESHELGLAESSDNGLLHRALAIAEFIAKTAIFSPEGDAAWISQTYRLDGDFWQFQPIRLDFYNGSSGIAVFFAALQRITGLQKYGELARAALGTILRLTSRDILEWVQREKIGAGLGSPSVVYSLVKIAALLEDDLLLRVATNIAFALEQEQIIADGRFDLMSGAAGCLVALRALYATVPHPWILKKIRACAAHLLNARKPAPSGLQSWPTLEGRFLNGFAHGSFGIAYALSQAYQLSGDESFGQVALEVYRTSPAEPADVETHDPVDHHEGLTWCQGDVGISLSKLADADLGMTSFGSQDFTALEAMATKPLGHLDFPCCGNLGRVELLLTAAQNLSRPDLLSAARNLSRRIIDRAVLQKRWGLGPRSSAHAPSFHQGLAGIGYMLLRTERPELPAVLIWE